MPLFVVMLILVVVISADDFDTSVESIRHTRSRNSDRALGFKSNKGQAALMSKNKSAYPWSTKTVVNYKTKSTGTMRSFERKDEEPFGDFYYDNYDFEFAKSGFRNDNFDKKSKAYQASKRASKGG